MVAVLTCGAALWAQDTAPTPETVEEALRQMSDAAGVIFVGEVSAVRQREGEYGASGIVEVDFRVDQAIRGCAAGSLYTLREWAGLWAAGEQRYLPGQRLLMLLHAPGAAGFSSPVGGMAGAIPLRGTATSPLAGSASTAATGEIADLRWVGTRLLRTIPRSTSPVVTGTGQAATAQAGTGQARAGQAGDGQAGEAPSDSAGDASIASQQALVSVVVDMLRSWQPGGR
jgi:hypothetical protein